MTQKTKDTILITVVIIIAVFGDIIYNAIFNIKP